MRRRHPTDLACELARFFEDFLPTQRGLSPHTIRNHRDGILLLLQCASRELKRPVERLEISNLTAGLVTRFLGSLETERHNGIPTRNARLGTIHVFAKFMAAHRPEHLALLQQLIGIPLKRGAVESPIEYMDRNEIDALLSSIDRRTRLGRRDYALFALMFNTGARVQEMLDLRTRDVRFDVPPQVRLLGKGKKVRVCPVWPAVARLLKQLILEFHRASEDAADQLIFTNARGQCLTRYGVRYLLRRYVRKAARTVPSLRGKKLHPHSIRHSTAIALLKAGVDFATISQWLGHAGLNTTMRYARVDLDLKRQALAQVFPTSIAPPRGGRLLIDGSDVIGWLRRM